MRRTALLALVPLATIGCSDIFGSSDDGGSGGPSVGDILTFNVPRTGENGCEATANPRVGEVVGVTSQTIVVADTLAPPNGLGHEAYAQLGADFDRWGYSVVEQYFGEPSDLDENGRVIAFFTEAVNQLSDRQGDSIIFGMFWPGDLFPAEDCATSNYAEIFYMAVADQNGTVGPEVDSTAIRRSAVSTMGHEFQHLVNAARRLYEPPQATDFEEVWLNEALSHITEELMFFERTNAEPGQNIDVDWLRQADTRSSAFNDFQIQNVQRLAIFLEAPDTAAASLLDPDAPLASRGSGWHFMRYAADRKGSQADIWWDLVNTANSGMTNLQQVLDANVDNWVRDWSAAVFADDEAPVDARFTFPSWNMRDIYPAIQSRDEQVYPEYPLRIRELDDSQPVDLDLAAMTAAFLQIGVESGDTATITFTSGGGEPPSELRVSVVNVENGEVSQVAGSDAGTIELEGSGTYVVVPAHISDAEATLALNVASEHATPTLASVSPRPSTNARDLPLSLSVGPTSSGASLPVVDDHFHIEFLERAQRELAPRVANARRVYQRRQLERRAP